MKKVIPLELFLSFLAVIFLSDISLASSADKILTSDSFIIKYNSDNTGCAAALSLKLTSYHDRIADFLVIDSLERVNIFLSSVKSKNLLPLVTNKISNDLFVSTDSNFNYIEGELYNQIFLIYLNKIMQDGKGFSVIGKNFIEAILHYPGTEHEFIELMQIDLVNVMKTISVDFNEIEKYNKDEQHAIYTALIDFIISSYGKKVFTQSLKDAYYYNGFYQSLSKISGDPIAAISQNFNSFLQKKKSSLSVETENIDQQVHNSDEFTDISYSISDYEQTAVLQKNENIFRLLLKKGDSENSFILKKSESNSFFSKLVFLDNDRLAIIEILESGSSIHIYDVKNNKFLNNTFLYLLFITEINTLSDRNLIFSASCGMTSDIYTFNMNSRKLNIITSSGNNNYPIAINGKIYYISENNRSNILELDTATGGIKNIFSTDQKIYDLNKKNNKSLIFSIKINGINKIFELDLHEGSLKQITKDNRSRLTPQFSGKHLYFFSFYKSRYQLFYNILD